jgi:hypothetical protein
VQKIQMINQILCQENSIARKEKLAAQEERRKSFVETK